MNIYFMNSLKVNNNWTWIDLVMIISDAHIQIPVLFEENNREAVLVTLSAVTQ